MTEAEKKTEEPEEATDEGAEEAAEAEAGPAEDSGDLDPLQRLEAENAELRDQLRDLKSAISVTDARALREEQRQRQSALDDARSTLATLEEEHGNTKEHLAALETRAADLATRSIKRGAKARGLELVVAMIDLTTLEGMDSPGKVRHLCSKAVRPLPRRADVPSCAAVCVYSDLVPVAVAATAGSGVQVASVATGFPAGRTDRRTVRQDPDDC